MTDSPCVPVSMPSRTLSSRTLPSRLLALLVVSSLSLGLIACTSSSADAPPPEQPAAEAEDESIEAMRYEVPAYTDERSVQQRLNDATVATQIKRALIRQQALRLFDFTPEVRGRTVTLRGDVNTKAQWRRAGAVAERVAPDREVVNAVTVGGRPADEVSESDGQDVAEVAVYHTVQRGESLWVIARQYGASVQRLRALNDMGAGGLQAGERIRVR